MVGAGSGVDSTTARAEHPEMAWGTYVGGDSDEYAGAVAVGHAGDVYFCGETTSGNGISTPGAHQEMHGGGLFDATWPASPRKARACGAPTPTRRCGHSGCCLRAAN